ncbi:glycosyltransferase [Burkholderia gladioli]|uniref:Glycosyltransferase n=1 Tax=Burkholderia gladioli TaxID=28095 RepID=A0AB38TRA1_BURGA|nr:glycosyltransferase [Burkholderia gladioli]MBU9269702.1 glycosyltransferase [Burkholderia gladioli]PRH08656.1 glycosyl transferase [Burkholderia gladioli]UWX70953.1 glycosyltransferase [Burkholderia gladioli]
MTGQLEQPAPAAAHLRVSIVVYRPDMPALVRTVERLAAAIVQARASRGALSATVVLVDNGGLGEAAAGLLRRLDEAGIETRVIAGHGNVGYGRGHNLAIVPDASGFHLLLNPDIDLAPDALEQAFAFLDAHADVGLLSPYVAGPSGAMEYLCRRPPTVLSLFVRGFLPARLRAPFAARLADYEMRDLVDGEHVLFDPPIVSGCFMLFRADILAALGGFDPRYFLYFEDYDLSLRTHALTRIAYVPSVRTAHYGGQAARKGWLHIRLFAASSFRFFTRFGWRWW